MSRRDSDITPVAKRSIRTIQSELEFLADAEFISQQQLQSILGLLPSATTLQPPTQSFSNLGVGNSCPRNQNSFSPTPVPTAVQSPPPAQQYQPPPAYPATPAPPSASDALTHASALYAYKPTDPYDLELNAGDRIAVTEYMNEEWWKGRSERTGREGIFPRNYVRVEEKLPAAPLPPRNPSYSNNMPMNVASNNNNNGGNAQPGNPQGPSKGKEMGKNVGKKIGNAAAFGAGATIGSKIVNGIF